VKSRVSALAAKVAEAVMAPSTNVRRITCLMDTGRPLDAYGDK